MSEQAANRLILENDGELPVTLSDPALIPVSEIADLFLVNPDHRALLHEGRVKKKGREHLFDENNGNRILRRLCLIAFAFIVITAFALSVFSVARNNNIENFSEPLTCFSPIVIIPLFIVIIESIGLILISLDERSATLSRITGQISKGMVTALQESRSHYKIRYVFTTPQDVQRQGNITLPKESLFHYGHPEGKPIPGTPVVVHYVNAWNYRLL